MLSLENYNLGEIQINLKLYGAEEGLKQDSPTLNLKLFPNLTTES